MNPLRVTFAILFAFSLLTCTSQTASAATTVSKLKIVYQESSDSPKVTWTLNCKPNSGTFPGVAVACKKLTSLKVPFAKPPADQMCSEIYGGDQTAVITGTWLGKKVSRKFSRVNGCEIDTWESFYPILPRVQGVTQ
ncbi:MAG: hypothetical protein F2718_01245 [Actinobacteria bacterium]|uniref:Unannotated protein n=1 Tax=freshwater metagenome TaxID=449393 RepID=A0A6J7S1X1_9ZZZZ|nr:hypothetical protein [Actinomycetota bacterium]MSY26666.1 hypothetical protein [Actinomycetota bacterium]MSZ86274.1 hypothetical protein [Actinomycetota bacterium]MTB13785.1 hypothetical protein [Actinomycetota bacterium]MTB24501.1 hypothetical protein [Actinomycetota bacterium]